MPTLSMSSSMAPGDIELVDAMFGPSLNPRFESRIKGYVDGMRKSSGEPSLFAHFDCLWAVQRKTSERSPVPEPGNLLT